ncbi:YELLOW STRIPE like 7 [Actinidia rufa]|uniref:YELLOW STRIPE like 7 n=1 Tax=Actinidia rufa TaxID=165716 RepID=A0A7J0DIZ6_9ERIC|nr:YELLOW STRIPE like 7 [Actinidia rufa]
MTTVQRIILYIFSFKYEHAGGFGSYLLGMSDIIANQSTEANSPQDIKNPTLGWMIGFLFVVSFLGLFSVVPLRKIMIIDYKLIYPSGTATAHLINSFHTPQGAKLAKKQVRSLGKFFSFSFLWGFFQWFFTAGDGCGFANFPSFGLKAYENRFYFDFSATYVGVGMICPYLINVSLLIGAILSWGIMWPLIHEQRGHWYPAELKSTSLHGLQGYRVFIGIAMILGDGLYNFVKVLGHTLFSLYRQFRDKDPGSVLPVGVVGYVGIAIISAATLPHIFHQLKWYYIVVLYVIAPTLAFCNAYGCGLTDWSLASTYGKLAIFTIGAWAGANHGGVLAGLAACGVMMNIVSTASDLMQDFKNRLYDTGFTTAFHDLGIPGTQYPAPYGLVYRNMSILGVEGFSALPKHCLTLCYVFFIGAVIINAFRDVVGKEKAKFIPIPMAMAIPFYIGSYFAIDMCVGSMILFVWSKINKAKADAFGPAVASGLICGDGIWTLPSSILALVGVNPPICMKFLSRKTNAEVDTFLT